MKNKTKKVEFTIHPEQGAMHLINSAPKGYRVKSIDRKGTKAVVTYERC